MTEAPRVARRSLGFEGISDHAPTGTIEEARQSIGGGIFTPEALISRNIVGKTSIPRHTEVNPCFLHRAAIRGLARPFNSVNLMNSRLICKGNHPSRAWHASYVVHRATLLRGMFLDGAWSLAVDTRQWETDRWSAGCIGGNGQYDARRCHPARLICDLH